MYGSVYYKKNAKKSLVIMYVITRFNLIDAQRAKRGRRSCCHVIMVKCARKVPKKQITIVVRIWPTCILSRSYFSARFW